MKWYSDIILGMQRILEGVQARIVSSKVSYHHLSKVKYNAMDHFSAKVAILSGMIPFKGQNLNFSTSIQH